MVLIWDPPIVANLVFCIIILVMGIWIYKKTKNKLPLYFGIAFGFFGISHVAAILGLATDLAYPLLATRVIGYLLSIYIVYKYLKP